MSDVVKLARLGIKRDPHLMYYVMGGDVWATPRSAPRAGAFKVADAGVEMDDKRYLYCVDLEGDVVAYPREPFARSSVPTIAQTEVIRDRGEMCARATALRADGKLIGVVLAQGKLNLVQQHSMAGARDHVDIVIAALVVDAGHPRDPACDLATLARWAPDFAFYVDRPSEIGFANAAWFAQLFDATQPDHVFMLDVPPTQGTAARQVIRDRATAIEIHGGLPGYR